MRLLQIAGRQIIDVVNVQSAVLEVLYWAEQSNQLMHDCLQIDI
jgi:hypothetical protein